MKIGDLVKFKISGQKGVIVRVSDLGFDVYNCRDRTVDYYGRSEIEPWSDLPLTVGDRVRNTLNGHTGTVIALNMIWCDHCQDRSDYVDWEKSDVWPKRERSNTVYGITPPFNDYVIIPHHADCVKGNGHLAIYKGRGVTGLIACKCETCDKLVYFAPDYVEVAGVEYMLGEWVVHKSTGIEGKIVAVDSNTPSIVKVRIGNSTYSYASWYDKGLWQRKTPAVEPGRVILLYWGDYD